MSKIIVINLPRSSIKSYHFLYRLISEFRVWWSLSCHRVKPGWRPVQFTIHQGSQFASNGGSDRTPTDTGRTSKLHTEGSLGQSQTHNLLVVKHHCVKITIDQSKNTHTQKKRQSQLLRVCSFQQLFRWRLRKDKPYRNKCAKCPCCYMISNR